MSLLVFAVDGVTRMQNLINALLTFSRVGRDDVEYQEISLEECLTDALRNLQIVMEETGTEVIHDELPRDKWRSHSNDPGSTKLSREWS